MILNFLFQGEQLLIGGSFMSIVSLGIITAAFGFLGDFI